MFWTWVSIFNQINILVDRQKKKKSDMQSFIFIPSKKQKQKQTKKMK